MLRIYKDVQVMQGDAKAIFRRVAVHDRNLAQQLRRSAQSVASNLCEGMAARGGHRRNAYEAALREAEETLGTIFTAEQWGYLEADAIVLDRLDKIIKTLCRLTTPQT